MFSNIIYFISNRDMRKNRADSVHIMRICRELSRNEFKVKLVTPKVIRFEYRKKKKDIWKINKVDESFEVVELPTFLFDNISGKLIVYSHFMKLINYSIYYLIQIIICKLRKTDIIYSVDYLTLLPAIFLKKMGILKAKLFISKGDIFDDWIRCFVIKNVDGVIAINNYIRETTINQHTIASKKVYRPSFPSMYDDFVEFNKFEMNYYRKHLAIPLNDKIVVYSGKISPALVEIDLLLKTAKLLLSENIKFYFIGIRNISKKYFREYIRENCLNNVTFIDFQPVESFMRYVKMADILVSYYDGSDINSSYLRVPAKASMYLSSDIPSVFADVPSLREWFTDDMVYFVKPNSPVKLAEKILHIFANPEEAKRKARASLEFAKINDYKKSYGGVSDFIKSFD